MKSCCLFLLAVSVQSLFANTWLVGPARSHTKPSQVAGLVQTGDTVLIDGGVYPGDVARWAADSLVIRGVGGRAHLKSGGIVYGGKAIWVIAGNDVKVEYIEFSEAACPDKNGAGIRSEGINLTVRNCYFHHNENGILAGDISSGDIVIEYSEFDANGHSNGQAHNLYINHAHSLVFRFNYSHDALVGHELKSRAYTNYIYCNRFSDENGSSSRSIDLPNGGFSVVVGNLIVQDPLSENSNLLGYGLEGANNPNSELYVAYNTFINNKGSGSFIHVANSIPALKVYDNIFAGPGSLIVGAPLLIDSFANRSAAVVAFHFEDPSAYDYRPAPGSMAIGAAQTPGLAGSYPLTPADEYLHPLNSITRLQSADIGAFETAKTSSGLSSQEAPAFDIYPNPCTDRLYIENGEKDLLWTLTDVAGKPLAQGDGLSTPVDMRPFAPGLYFIQLILNNHITVKRVLRL